MIRSQKSLAGNSLTGMTVGVLLFLGGLFLNVWSLGIASPLGLPLMLAGAVLPFLEAYLARRGESWSGYDGPVLSHRDDLRRYATQNVARRQTLAH